MRDDLADAVREATAAVLDETIAGLQDAIRTNSTNPASGGPGEADCQALVAAALRRLDCRVEIWEPDAAALAQRFPFIRASLPPAGFEGRPNVVGWLPAAEPAPDGRAHLILNTHVDTVAPGDATAWRRPPFDAAVDDGQVVGLGAVDAKGCLFAFLGAAAALRHAQIRLRRPVMLQAVVDEEASGAGTLDCLRRGYTATAAVVGEPTGLRVCPASRGAAHLRLRVVGRGAHPGEGWRGVNAIRKAWQYVEALDRLRDELDRTRMHPLWAPLSAGHVWNLLAIHAGPAADGTTGAAGPARSVPDVCEVHYGIGLIGDERPEAMRATVEAALAEVTRGDAWLADHPPELTWRPGGFEPAVTDPMHPAVLGLLDAAAAAGLDPSPPQAFSAATDGRHLTNAGGIPAVNFGPGAVHRAHSPNEALPVEELRRAMEVLAIFLARFCGIAAAYC
ncbi:MAG: M20/M25/M40 family metallo-hydrolase [Armatimonadota bacterium]|nr:M20/M25/M40 family metallo-hydrolase [Armatimonadota bacterium]